MESYFDMGISVGKGIQVKEWLVCDVLSIWKYGCASKIVWN